MAFLLFFCLLAMACWWFASSQRKALEEHLGATLTIMGENIDEYLMSLEKLGFGVSSNWSVINVYSGSGYNTEGGSAVANSHQLMSLLCSIETSLADVMIVDINGVGKSYFSGVDYNIISEITSQEELHDPHALGRSFHFFPPESQWSNVYFAYSVPILNLDAWPGDSQKVATGLLLCNKSRLSRLLMTETALSYEYFALYQGDDCVFSSAPAQPAPGPGTLIQEVPLSRGGLTLRGAATLGQVQGGFGLVLLFGGGCFLSAGLFLVLLLQFTRRFILGPINGTTAQLAGYQGEDLSEHIAYSGVKEIDTIIVDINRMIDKIKYATRQILLTQNTLYETELRTKEAELYALQSQVNPHFLYNTLQCICGLAAMGRTRDIQEIALAMSDVFKYSIHPGTFVDCAEEVGIICQYLSIYKIRYDGQLDYEINVEEPLLDCRILKMIIQPTVENAMLHAYNGTDKKPAIHIYGQREGEDLVFNIIDNGTGIPREKLLKIQENLGRSFSESIQEASPFGLGLYNISRRIKLVYGESYGISLFSNPNGTQVDIRIPAQPPDHPALP